jgi:nucleotide-binding universal stress UspA family protein
VSFGYADLSRVRQGAKEMIFTTILVQLDVDSPASPRLAFAQEIAGRFEADLIAIVAAQARIFVPSDENGQVAAEVMKRRRTQIEDRFKTLKEEFLSVTGGNGRASWRAELSDPTGTVALHARAADLVVTGAPAPAAAGDSRRTVDAGELILSAGRPVLFAADDMKPLRAETIVVAWKDAREARRAVIDAMPFLTNAKEVVVAAVAAAGDQFAGDSIADVVRFLMKRGVQARSEILEAGRSDAAGMLADKASEIGADLVVAGGYGHSRIREWAFGGVTRSLLGAGSFHRLLSN